MVDQDLVDYIKKYRTQFDMDQLRKGLMDQGVEYRDIKEALDFIDQEKREKIAEIIKGDDIFGEEEEKTLHKRNIMKEVRGMVEGVGDKIGEGGYKEKISGAWDSVSSSLGVKRDDKTLYFDAIRYGAISFLFLTLIESIFRYLGGRIVIPQLVTQFKDFWYANFPDIFLSKIFTFDFLLGMAWSMVVGGVLSFIFVKFLAKIWPFKLWHKLNKKVFALFLIFELIFGFVFAVSFSEITFKHILGYLVVFVGIVLASYLSSSYFATNMERKHEERIREIIK
ncbi:MAG TPA: hypothetical protein P5096_01065 [Patescibacteria group bacterium]|nr:hypothetical protein [Patescibacteria group bacterium]